MTATLPSDDRSGRRSTDDTIKNSSVVIRVIRVPVSRLSSNTCTTCLTSIFCPLRRRPHSSCSRQPGLALTTSSAPVAATSAILRSSRLSAIGVCVRL